MISSVDGHYRHNHRRLVCRQSNHGLTRRLPGRLKRAVAQIVDCLRRSLWETEITEKGGKKNQQLERKNKTGNQTTRTINSWNEDEVHGEGEGVHDIKQTLTQSSPSRGNKEPSSPSTPRKLPSRSSIESKTLISMHSSAAFGSDAFIPCAF